MASSSPNSPASTGSGPMQRLVSKETYLTQRNVYELGRDIAQEIKKITLLSGEEEVKDLVEKVVQALEWLELHVEKIEELRATNCKLLLKADELLTEKTRRKNLQSELEGMKLVTEERGRQRDTLSMRVSELERQVSAYEERIDDIKQFQIHKQRTQHYSTMKTLLEADHYTKMSRTKSLDRQIDRQMYNKGQRMKKKESIVERLEKELDEEKKKITEMKETRALEQRRVQQRMKYMEKEIAELNKQLATAQTNIQKLNEEKTVLMKRGEIIREVKAITLASVARENHENGRSSFSDDSDEIPTFYKKDLMMILKERNELKLTISSLQEELYTIKLRLKDYEAELKPQRKSMTLVSRRKKPSSLASPVFNDDVKDYTERVEESMVIVEKTDTLSIPTKHKRPISYSSPVFHSSSESLSQCSTVIEVPPPNKLKERHLSISTSL